MDWKRLLARFRRDEMLSELAGEIAHRSRAAVWERISHRAGRMGLSEGRGYIRARAAAVIAVEVDRALSTETSIDAGQRVALAQRATGRVVRLVIRDLLTGRPAAAVLRRAA